MNQFRESELKHGRVAMLASVGFMVQPWFHPLAEPLKIAFVDTGNTGRSLMAETLAPGFAKGLSRPVVFISRGVEVDPFDAAAEVNARLLMAKRGHNVAQHRAQHVAH
jgi:protein-tyrosine phosphatase